jgi:hypothetical protein
MRTLLSGLILALGLMITQAPAAEISTVKMDDGKTAIWLRGHIVRDDTDKFKRLAFAVHEQMGMPYNEIVVLLNSDGGEVGALDIGEFIHLKEMQTSVYQNAECYSLCAWIWLAGIKRWIGRNAKIGFHMAHPALGLKTTLKDHLMANSVIAMYLGRLGFSYDLLGWAINAGENIALLTPALAAQFNIEYEVIPVAPQNSYAPGPNSSSHAWRIGSVWYHSRAPSF